MGLRVLLLSFVSLPSRLYFYGGFFLSDKLVRTFVIFCQWICLTRLVDPFVRPRFLCAAGGARRDESVNGQKREEGPSIDNGLL